MAKKEVNNNAKKDVKKEKKKNSFLEGLRASSPRWLADILLFAAVWSLLGGFFHWLMPPVEDGISTLLFLLGLPVEFSFLNAIVLFILSRMIRHRRRIALWFVILYFQLAAVVIALIVIILSQTGGIDASLSDVLWYGLAILVNLLLGIFLVSAHNYFMTKVSKKVTTQAIVIVVAGLIVAILIGFVLGLILGEGHHPLHLLSAVFLESISNFRYLLPYGTILIDNKFLDSQVLLLVVDFVSMLGFLIAFILVMRNHNKKMESNAKDELKVRKLLMESAGKDSLAYFATRRDKAKIFSNNGKAAIAYQLFGSVLLASGDPIGEKKSWGSAVKNYLNFAYSKGWTPAVLAVTEEGLAVYKKQGLSHFTFGDEAVVLVKDFALDDPALREVNKVYNKVEKQGYSLVIRRQAEISLDELSELDGYVNSWRNDGPERGFSMASSRFADQTDAQMVVVVAYDSEGKAQGILSFVPGDRLLSLDTMRRNPDSANGVTTYMIAGLIEKCPALDVDEVSLNFAVMRHVFERGEQVQANSFERRARRVLLFFSRWYQLESLYRSNEIYAPEWRTRYLAYERGASATEVGLAMGRAEGFVSFGFFDKIKKFFIRHKQNSQQNDYWESESFIAQVQKQEADFMAKQAKKELDPHQVTALEKLALVKEAEINPYPTNLSVDTIRIQTARQLAEESPASVYGRVKSIRGRGKLFFVDLEDATGKVQVMLGADRVNEYAEATGLKEDFNLFKKAVIAGDMLQVSGEMTMTKTGEISLRATSWKLLSKSLTEFEDQLNAEALGIISQLREAFKAKGYSESLAGLSISEMLFETGTASFAVTAGQLTAVSAFTSPDALAEEAQTILSGILPEVDLSSLIQTQAEENNPENYRKEEDFDSRHLKLLERGLPSYSSLTINLEKLWEQLKS
ncbi:phosphatidylglycerol lysyltransferase domain-containing protein [Lactococcus termiticola]|uniref:Lysyl-tRNA synthetase n=1 Tax=Lactococcus termiticola TaxID=2169526 RepID=A0A2R5HGN6_9LACT|nr:phosphatidylglycerol lysyltransferase domain-containing protein [Lactococcus termiticola]GBG97223.1 lysyl-tRNA synthetase [Lactococcus termiticola]